MRKLCARKNRQKRGAQTLRTRRRESPQASLPHRPPSPLSRTARPCHRARKPEAGRANFAHSKTAKNRTRKLCAREGRWPGRPFGTQGGSTRNAKSRPRQKQVVRSDCDCGPSASRLRQDRVRKSPERRCANFAHAKTAKNRMRKLCAREGREEGDVRKLCACRPDAFWLQALGVESPRGRETRAAQRRTRKRALHPRAETFRCGRGGAQCQERLCSKRQYPIRSRRRPKDAGGWQRETRRKQGRAQPHEATRRLGMRHQESSNARSRPNGERGTTQRRQKDETAKEGKKKRG